MKNFRTVYQEAAVEIIISKSRFIGYVCPVTTEEEALQFIEAKKKKHWDATHNVPVYMIGDNFGVQRYSDDGEPSGTAGVPILEMLKKEGITNVCIVVTRYFGGIKLGTGGLVRAYTQTAKAALEGAQIVDEKIFLLYEVTCDYHQHGKLQNYFSNHEHVLIKESIFTDQVKMLLYFEPQYENEIVKQIIEIASGNIITERIDENYLIVHNQQILDERKHDNY